MFGTNKPANSLFGNANIATPSTSTPTNNNVFSFNKPSTDSVNLFGNNNVSTPSPGNPSGFGGTRTSQPTVNLFGNAGNATSTQTNTPQNNSIFGSTAQNPAGAFNSQGSLLSNKANVPQPGGIGGPAQSTSSGLFGNAVNQNNTPLPGSEGSNSTVLGSGSLFGGNNKSDQLGGNMFENRTKTGSLGSATTTAGGGNIFGNNSTGANSLFGNKSTLGTSATPSSSLFGGSNSNTASSSLFAGKSNGANSIFSSGSTLAQNQQQSNQSQLINSNPYGMQINSGPILSMPESITVPMYSEKNQIKEESKSAKISTASVSERELSSLNNSTLIGKLSSHLKTLKSRETAHGLFSPSSSTILKQENLASISRDEKTDKSTKGLGSSSSISFLFKKKDFSDIKRLTIDSNRSASKKMKLLNNTSLATKVRSLGEKKDNEESESHNKLAAKETEILEHDISGSRKVANDQTSTKNDGYWCSHSIEQMKSFSQEQLKRVSNFVVGRQGYGSINFNYDVDLTAFAEDFENTLFGSTIIFNDNKTVEVYPDEDKKPSVGEGLNVPATITLQNVYPTDCKTKEPIRDNSKVDEVQYFVKRLKNMKDMEFISYNPFGGIWVFRVKHFSIWGLVDDEDDAELDNNGEKKAAETEVKDRTIAMPRRPLISNNGTDPQMFAPYESTKGDSQTENLSFKEDKSPPATSFLDQMSVEGDDISLIIEEKPYEPSDVEEDDLFIFETTPNLKISSNWLNQLDLCSSQSFSIFNSSSEVEKISKNAMDDLLFPSFKKDLQKYQTITEERKLYSEVFFAKFTKKCGILRKKDNELSGCRQVYFKSTLQIKKSAFDSVFSDYLNSAVITPRENSYPLVKHCSLSFEDIAQAYSNVPNEYRILELASILFDSISLSCATESEKVTTALVKKARYDKICDWIVRETSNEIDSLLETTTGLQKVYLLLAKNDIVGAAKEAILSKNKHLSAIISLLGSNDPEVRTIAEEQLVRWKSLNANVDPTIFKIYELLAGVPFDHSIYNAETSNLPWLTIFGFHLFFGDIDSLSLEQLVSNCVEKSLEIFKENADPLVLNIFKLFASPSTPVEILIDDLMFGGDRFDSRLSWFFTHIIKRDDISDIIRDRVTLQFLEQLKVDMMLKEALFVSCFLKNDVVAKEQIDLLLSSEISYFTSNDNLSILKRLAIPEHVIYQYMALFDKYNNDSLSEVQNLLKANSFKEAENVILTKVGPELVIASFSKHDSLHLLHKLLSTFPRDKIPCWEKGLGVFENYLRLVLNEENDITIMEKLIKTLPNLYFENKSSEMIGIVCSVISEKVSQLYLAKNEGQLTDVVKEKLLSLPLGGPEYIYLERILSSL